MGEEVTFTVKYMFKVEKGDIVLMPNGLVGIVSYKEFMVGGCSLEIRVYPFTNWLYRFFLFLTLRLQFTDEEINYLQLIHPAKDSDGKR